MAAGRQMADRPPKILGESVMQFRGHYFRLSRPLTMVIRGRARNKIADEIAAARDRLIIHLAC